MSVADIPVKLYNIICLPAAPRIHSPLRPFLGHVFKELVLFSQASYFIFIGFHGHSIEKGVYIHI